MKLKAKDVKVFRFNNLRILVYQQNRNIMYKNKCILPYYMLFYKANRKMRSRIP